MFLTRGCKMPMRRNICVSSDMGEVRGEVRVMLRCPLCVQMFDTIVQQSLSNSHAGDKFWIRIQAAHLKTGLMELRRVRKNTVSGTRRVCSQI